MSSRLRSSERADFCEFSNMECDKIHFRHILRFYFHKGRSALQAHKKIIAVYGDNALSKSTAEFWFRRFRSGNFDVEDAARSGRPIEANVDEIQNKIMEDQRITTRQIAEELHIAHSTVSRQIKKLGLTKKLDIWVPHRLSDKNVIDRIAICDSLLKRNNSDPFLKRIVTGDEKWVLYEDVTRKRSWCKPGEKPQICAKAGLHPKKSLLSVWWDWKGVIHFEVIPHGQTINSEIYCAQLERLNETLCAKRPELVNRRGVILHQDNARPHTSLVTRQKILQLGWEVLPHPPYSPDIAPSDYHLFLSLQNSHRGKNLHSSDDLKRHLQQFFDSKAPTFYSDGILCLPERWQQVLDNNGQYITN